MRIVLSVLAAGTITVAQQNSYSFALDSIDSHVMMTIQTLNPVPCLGTSIRNQVQWGEDTIVIIVAGFIRPTPCMDGVEPALARILLGRQLKATFYLRFREEKSDDLWSVSRTERGFQLTPVHRSFTSYLKK
jgi:hypothetical protein